MSRNTCFGGAALFFILSSLISAAMVTDGLIIHLEADALTGLNDGDIVTVWPDAAADGVDGTMETVDAYPGPVYKTGVLSGQPVVRFTRTDGSLLGSAAWQFPDVEAGITLIAVFTGGDSGFVERLAQIGAADGTVSKVVGADASAGGTARSGGRFNNGYALNAADGANPLTAGNFHIGIWQMAQDGRHDSLFYAVDDLEAETLDCNNPDNVITFNHADNTLTVGNGRLGGGSWASDFYSGDVAEILVYNARLSPLQLSQTCRYLGDKYDLPFVGGEIAVSQSAATTVVREGGFDDTISLSLSLNPGQPVTVTMTDTQHQVTADPSQLVFTSGNWQTPQAVTISAVDDTRRECLEQTSRLSFEVLTDMGSAYFGAVIEDVNVIIEDDDCGARTFSHPDLNADGRVDLADFAHLADAWLRADVSHTPGSGLADLDFDGRVDAADLMRLTDAWTRSTPLAWYSLDQGVGSAIRDRLHPQDDGADGTLTNTDDAVWQQGYRGNALTFDGADDYAAVPNCVGGDFTIAFWIRTTGGGTAGLIDAGNQFRLLLDAGRVTFGVGPFASQALIQSDAVVNDGSWHHVAAIRRADTGRMILYVDGSESAAGNGPPGIMKTAANLHLGTMLSDGRFFQGQMDEVRLFGGVLDAAAVEEMAAMDGGWAPIGENLLTCWAKTIDPETGAWPDYPRPQMQRTPWQTLNGAWGDWEFAIREKSDPNPPAFYDGSILVPFGIESQLSGVGKPLTENQYLWYRRTFEIPADWSGRAVLLHFEAVDYEAAVWVDDQPVGTHTGGYDPFSMDITDALNGSQTHELIVRVWDPTDAEAIACGKQRQGKLADPSGIFYTSSSGLWQTVWMEPVAPAPYRYIRDVKLVPDLYNSELVVTTQTVGTGDETICITVSDADGVVAQLANQPPDQPVAVPIADPHLWSPDDPFLYDVRVQVVKVIGSSTVELDTVHCYAGMRQVRVGISGSARKILLNGQPLYQAGTLDQGFWPGGGYTAPSDAAMQWEIAAMKQMGFNTVRKHLKVEPRRWYYWCDVLGLLVWQDMPSLPTAYGDTGPGKTPVPESAKTAFENQLQAMIETHAGHPSIIQWILFNGGWGQYDTERLTGWIMQTLDPTRLVTGASGGVDYPVGDIRDFNSYPWPQTALVADRAVVCGEFGGFSQRLAGHLWAPQVLPPHWDEPDFNTFSGSQLLAQYERAVDLLVRQRIDNGLSGSCYTQWADVETETSGWLTYDRYRKVEPSEAAAINSRLTVPLASDTMTVMATNVNENLEQYSSLGDELQQVNARWVRGFDPKIISRIGDGVPTINTDAKLRGVRDASNAGYNVIYSMKIILDGENGRDDITAYEPGSAKEAALWQAVDDLLGVVGPYVDILVVGNEPLVETKPNAFSRSPQGGAWGGGYPLVVFYDRLSDHVISTLQSNPSLGHIDVYCGALTNLDAASWWDINQGYLRAFIEMVDGKPGLTGLDIHTHTADMAGGAPDPDYGETSACLAAARLWTDKPLLVTEFSLVWRYKLHLNETLGADAAGQAFAAAYGYSSAMPVWDYLDHCFDSRRPRSEWIAFCNSRSWWEPNYLLHMQELFTEYNVKAAAFRLIQSGSPTVTADTNPWFLNAMLQPAMIRAPGDGSVAENYDFAHDFRYLNSQYPSVNQ